MPEPAKPFPEFGASTDPKAVPWADAVVWSERTADGARVYDWIPKQHIQTASWSSGAVSIEVHHESFLFGSVMYFQIRAPFVSIGKNVPVG